MKNLYLIGFMGSGKTTVGKLVARNLRCSFVDVDDLITKEFGTSIRNIFESHGEEGFRSVERDILVNLSRQQDLVVATGGGAYENPDNRRLIKQSGNVIFLNASLDTITTRLSQNERELRPLWTNLDDLRSLFHRRLKSFEDCTKIITVDEQSPLETASVICSYLCGEQQIVVTYEDKRCKVCSVWNGPAHITQYTSNRKTVILTDQNVERLHLHRYLDCLDDSIIISIKPGEKSKSIRTVNHIYEQLLDAKIGRDDLLLVIGGGVITDIGGFVAGTFKRGIDFILVGSTMVASVDAAIGGKSAIDVGKVKNSVGLFTKPLTTILDLSCLHTLKHGHIREGLVEAYKTGLVYNTKLSFYMEHNIQALINGSVPELCQVLNASSRAKCDIVSKDFREKNLRKILNFGHTYGHAVESYNNYSISHGLAVSKGMLVAMNISLQRGLLTEAESVGSIQTINKISKGKVKLPSAEDAWQIMMNDKKNSSDKITFVLLSGKGQCSIVNDISKSELDLAIRKTRDYDNV